MMELEVNAVYTLPEAARLLKVHERTLWRLVRAGRIPAFRVGRQWRLYGRALLDLNGQDAEAEPRDLQASGD